MRFIGKALAITIREIMFFLFGFKAMKAIKYLFAIQPRAESVKPNRYISTALGVCDMAINLILWPFGLRKKRDWKLVYQIWCTERSRDTDDATRKQDTSRRRNSKRRDDHGVRGVHGYENAA
jgi:hypothetical protein